MDTLPVLYVCFIVTHVRSKKKKKKKKKKKAGEAWEQGYYSSANDFLTSQ